MRIRRSALRLLFDSTQRRHLFRWLESLQTDYFLRKRQPWLVFDAIDFLGSLTMQNNRVFEYGSGGSTLYWLAQGAQLTSVEHDRSWYCLLRERYLQDQVVDYRLVEPEKIQQTELDPGNPNDYSSSDILFSRHSFQRYCSQIDEYADNTFDIVLIDGRARPSCLKHAHKKVKVGGFLILDNSDRDYYLFMTVPFLQDYTRKIFRGAAPGLSWFTETSIFTRMA